MVRDPSVFLFDEPLSNLDAKLRVEMRTEIRRLHQDLKATSIYVTHDQVEAMTMADRIVVLNGGGIVQQGAPMELFDRPASVFVATFIGSPQMNIFDGHLEQSEAGPARLCFEDTRIDLLGLASKPVQDIVWGVRPDDFALCETADAAIVGEVTVVEQTGGETLIFVDTSLGNLCVKAPPRIKVKIGETVGVSIDLENLHLFDRATEMRLDLGHVQKMAG
jgi:ABC-type sugar transport system ATPase subunit